MASDQPRLVTGFLTMLEIGGQQTTRRHAFIDALDVHSLALTQDNPILDEPRCRLTEHDTPRR
ncbi:MAG: hypothetical protein WBW75_16125, partial [Mycobacterium sp.]|uniref:hypothetical protein n=1 Tax=Mycobacterium sp. TaxID=1785 RepID=UPI003C336EDE